MTDQQDLLTHIKGVIEGHKREIKIQYGEMKIRLPAYIKSMTIKELRDAGATVDPNISIPRGLDNRIRKQALVNQKIKEVRESYRNQVIKYYDDLKKKLAQDLLAKKLGELDDNERVQLGIESSNQIN